MFEFISLWLSKRKRGTGERGGVREGGTVIFEVIRETLLKSNAQARNGN